MATEFSPVWQPDWAIPPGDVLLEVLEERGMTQTELARRTGRPVKTINEIINAKAAITPETAIQLERVLGTNARFWTNLEANYRAASARRQAMTDLEKESDWGSRFPLTLLAKYGLIRRHTSRAETVSEILAFFGVSSRAVWERHWLAPNASFRSPAIASSSPESVAAWLRWGELQASGVRSDAFSPGSFRRTLDTVRRLTRRAPVSAALAEVALACRLAGVVLVVTPELPAAPISGATRWLSSTRVLIQLSLRYKTDDQLWFTLFHEAGHVLLPRKHTDFVDALDSAPADQGAEEEADRFARDAMIAPIDYKLFVEAGDFGESPIRSFAQRLEIAPGIVVARLQRDRLLDWDRLNGLKRHIRVVPPAPRIHP